MAEEKGFPEIRSVGLPPGEYQVEPQSQLVQIDQRGGGKRLVTGMKSSIGITVYEEPKQTDFASQGKESLKAAAIRVLDTQPIIDILETGTRFKVLPQEPVTLGVGTQKINLLPIQCEIEGKTVTGYAWLGDLAGNVVPTDQLKNEPSLNLPESFINAAAKATESEE